MQLLSGFPESRDLCTLRFLFSTHMDASRRFSQPFVCTTPIAATEGEGFFESLEKKKIVAKFRVAEIFHSIRVPELRQMKKVRNSNRPVFLVGDVFS